MDDEQVIANPPANLPYLVGQQMIHDEGWRPTPPPPPESETFKLNPAKSGTDYDTCPNPDCSTETEITHRIGTGSSMYTCSCCHTSWAREDKRQHERNEEKGLGAYSKALRTQDAATNRTVFTPTRRYSANYEKVFGHK